MVEEGDERYVDDRFRYNDEMNLEFWGLAFRDNPFSLKWSSGGALALKNATLSLGSIAFALTSAVAYLSF